MTTQVRQGIRPTPGSDTDFQDRWRMCFRKIHYATEAEANKAANRQTNQWKIPYRVYVCPVHAPAHWHITKRAAAKR